MNLETSLEHVYRPWKKASPGIGRRPPVSFHDTRRRHWRWQCAQHVWLFGCPGDPGSECVRDGDGSIGTPRKLGWKYEDEELKVGLARNVTLETYPKKDSRLRRGSMTVTVNIEHIEPLRSEKSKVAPTGSYGLTMFDGVIVICCLICRNWDPLHIKTEKIHDILCFHTRMIIMSCTSNQCVYTCVLCGSRVIVVYICLYYYKIL